MQAVRADGGPAYPTPNDESIIEGLSKRDVFAKEAMTVLLKAFLDANVVTKVEGDVHTIEHQPLTPGDLNDLGVQSYAVAGGMLRARAIV